jgi:hypothetical protein
MSDGTIAVARARDYHIDWFGADGGHTASPKVAHEWVHLSDADKQHMADSLTGVRDSANKVMLATMTAGNGGRSGNPMYDVAGRMIGMSFPAQAVARGGDAAPPPPPRPAPVTPPQVLSPVSPDVFPDYLPPFSSQALADADNHLWVMLPETMIDRTTASAYDIIDRKGVLIDRVRQPGSRIIGFGVGGILYVVTRDAGEVRLTKMSVKQ